MSSTIPSYTAELGKAGNCIRIGLPWTVTIDWTDTAGATRQLSAYTAKCKITSSDQPTATTLVTLTSTNGRITLGNSEPNITLSLSDADTTALPVTSGACFYLTLTDGAGKDIGLLFGPCPVEWWGSQ